MNKGLVWAMVVVAGASFYSLAVPWDAEAGHRGRGCHGNGGDCNGGGCNGGYNSNGAYQGCHGAAACNGSAHGAYHTGYRGYGNGGSLRTNRVGHPSDLPPGAPTFEPDRGDSPSSAPPHGQRAGRGISPDL